MNPDVALILFQYKRGDITPQQFIDEMRMLNYSTPQIMQVIADANNPRIRNPVIPEPEGGRTPAETAPPPVMAAAQTAPAAPPPRPAPVDPYAGMSPAEIALSKAQEAQNRKFWGPAGPAPEVPPGQRRPSYQTLAGLAARSQAVDPQKAAQAQTALDVARQKIVESTANKPMQTDFPPPAPPQPTPYTPGTASERAEEGPRMPYGDTMPVGYHSDRAEEGPSYGHTVQAAVNMAKRSAAPQMAASQTAPEAAAPQSDFLHSLIRGRFGDAAKGNPMDDRLTAFQEARDKSGEARASGGAVGGKDAALHKALEIIHHLIRTR